MTRQRLPDRRGGVVFDFEHVYPGAGPRTFTVTVGLYADGRPAEAFINLDGGNAKIAVDLHDAAVALSFALQHGADLAEIGKAMLRSEDGRAHGVLGSLTDAITREIGAAR